MKIIPIKHLLNDSSNNKMSCSNSDNKIEFEKDKHFEEQALDILDSKLFEDL